jgi:hypothetical protein
MASFHAFPRRRPGCLTNNVERAVRGIAATGPFAALTDGSHVFYTLIETANLKDVDPKSWIADVLAELPFIR